MLCQCYTGIMNPLNFNSFITLSNMVEVKEPAILSILLLALWNESLAAASRFSIVIISSKTRESSQK